MIPLLGSHNIRPYQTTWPVYRGDKPVAFRPDGDSGRHLVPSRNYVLLRRFSAKEERRRLTASWFLDGGGPPRFLALENHINYIYNCDRELATAEAYGLTAIFNSTLLDRYFRMLSGSTQVNATEIRSIHFPALDRVAAIGRWIEDSGERRPARIEEVVYDHLGIAPSLRDSVRYPA